MLMCFLARPGAARLRAYVLARLRASGGVEVVGTAGEADAVIEGNGETWVKEYLLSSTRGTGSVRQPVFGGYLSLELRDKNGETMWSYMVTPVMRRIGFDGSASSTVQRVPMPNQSSECFSRVTRTS